MRKRPISKIESAALSTVLVSGALLNTASGVEAQEQRDIKTFVDAWPTCEGVMEGNPEAIVQAEVSNQNDFPIEVKLVLAEQGFSTNWERYEPNTVRYMNDLHTGQYYLYEDNAIFYGREIGGEPQQLAAPDPIEETNCHPDKDIPPRDGGVGGDEPTTPVKRVAGPDRVSTATEVSKYSFDAADTALVATSTNFPDALAGAALAGALDAPILLTSPGELSDATEAELQRLGVENAVILGGTAAVSQTVEVELNSLGLNVSRIAGSNRYETAKKIADQANAMRALTPDTLDTEGQVMISTGQNFADALAAGNLSAGYEIPVLLTPTDALSEYALDYLTENEITRITILGGTAAIGANVEAQIEQATGLDAQRIAGANRYETAAKIAAATRSVQEIDHHQSGEQTEFVTERVWAATGQNFPDALAAGPAVARSGRDLFYLADDIPEDSSDAPAPQLIELKNSQEEQISLVVVGGESAVSANDELALRNLLSKN